MSSLIAGSPKLKVALIQRFVPHYNLIFYRKLAATSRYEWDFIFDAHPGAGESGLASDAVTLLPTRPIRNVYLGPAVWQQGVNDWLRQNRYRAVVFELGWQIISNPWLVRCAHQCGTAVIPWTKGSAESGRPRPWWRKQLERRFVHHCDAILAYGQVSSRYFQDYGYPAGRISIAQNTVDVRTIAENVPANRAQAVQLRAKLKLPPGEVVFGHLGRLVPQKHVDRIIEAFAAVRAQGLKAQLVIAGDGPERVALEALARTAGVEQAVHFCGRIPETEVGGYFQLFDVFVSAYSAGLAVMEAMAHGIIALITPEARPEIELIVDGQTGFITRDFSAAALQDGLHRAAAAVQQGDMIGQYAQARTLADATMEKMVTAFDQAIDHALQLRKSAK